MRHASLMPLLVVAVSPLAGMQLTPRQVDAGLGLLPADLRAGAEVLERVGGRYVVRRPGENAWACRISKPRADRLAATCYHRALAHMLDRNQELYDAGLPGDTVRERLGQDVMAGRLVIPTASMEISGSGPIPDGGEVPEQMSGYYFLYFPFATAAMLGVSGEDPGEGKPWLHDEGTAKAHLMWPRAHVP